MTDDAKQRIRDNGDGLHAVAPAAHDALIAAWKLQDRD